MRKTSFYGNKIIAAGFILLFFGIGLAINTFGVFMNEITRVMGFGETEFSLALTISAVVMMLSAIIVGKLIEKINIRIVMGVCTTLFAGAIILFSQCTQLVHFYLAAILMGIGSAGTHIIPVTTAINNWFVKRRGLATGIVFAGTGIGGLLLNPLVSWLISANPLGMQYGWQSAYMVTGILAGLFCIPTAIFIMRKTPQEMGQLPDGLAADSVEGQQEAAENETGMSLGESLASPVFWLIAAMAMFLSLINMGVNQHMVNYFNKELGFSAQIAAMLFGGYLGMTVLGKIVIGLVADRKGLAFAITMFISIVIGGFMILMNAQLLWVAILFVVICGFGNVIQTVIPPMVTANCLGTLHYGLIYGVISIFMTIGSGIGTPLTAVIFEKTGSYKPALMLFILLLIISLGLVLAALRLTTRSIKKAALA